MNRLRRVNNLSLHDCHRVARSIFEVNNSRFSDARNMQIRSIQRLGESPKYAVFSYSNETKIFMNVAIPSQAASIGETKNVSPCSNKINPFVVSNNAKNYGGFKRNFILSASDHRESFNRAHVRMFSDDSHKSIAIPSQHTQLDGFWKILSESAPVEITQNALVWLHSTAGLPWWATIIVVTWSLRVLVTLPLALYQSYILAKYYNLKPELDDIVKGLKYETNYAVAELKWTEKYARAIYNHSFKKQRQKLIERDNCHPMKSIILVLVQIPMWITLSASLRNLCYMLPYPDESARAIYLELTTGGFGWMMNLTVPDSTFVIPVTLGLLNLTIIEMQCLMRLSEPSKAQKYVTNFFRLLTLGMIPVAAYVPTAMSLYWASSSAFGIVQNYLLISPKLRRLARIPETDIELDRPYRHLYTNLRRRIGIKDDDPSTAEEKKKS